MRLLCCFLSLLLSGCVATAVGAAVGATVAVATAVVTVPVKLGGAALEAVTGDNEDNEDENND